MRISSIDAFRGFSIVLMVFFTLINRLATLPDVLQHNVADALHFGDFVLPFFLFASGMSLFFFARNREKKGRGGYALDIVERFGMLVLVSFMLSPFTAGGAFGMDEVMLNALLFVASVVLLALPELAIGAVSLFVFIVYLVLMKLAMLPDFDPTVYYLGGYAAAPFYLPVMLGGVIAGKRIGEGKPLAPLLAASIVISILLLALVSPYKMYASPSFMSLSVVLSLALFMLIDFFEKNKINLFWGFFEYLGTKPIRYWVLMFLFFVAPASFYALARGLEFPLGLDWPVAVLVALAYVPLLWMASKGIDLAEAAVNKRIVAGRK